MGRADDTTKLLAIGLLNFADDHGYFYADESLIRSALRPFDDSSTKVRRSIEQLVNLGYIEVKNTESHGPIGRIVAFTKHQRVDRPKASSINELWESTNDRRMIDDESTQEGKGTGKGIYTPKSPKGTWSPSDLQIEIGSWFGRKPTALWSEKELKAWRKLPDEIIEEGIPILRSPYRVKADYCRKNLQTLLNNWQGEMDRFRDWKPAGTNGGKPPSSLL